ncbi:Formyltransferase [Xylariaceae sp. FL0662B]|nr:Formyltransferase [Xylariaceae sp. FL0662B]
MLLRPVIATFRTRPWRSLTAVESALPRPPCFRGRVQPSLCCRRSYSGDAGADVDSATRVKKSDPLHVLFCGSDEFSCAALSALHREHVRNPELVRSIDVVVRPGKPTGRGMKTIRHPPIRSLATELGLPIHERPTFTGWDMPPHINIIIAVSFGLFVPPRLLRAAKYGGLNVHPSLLPDLRGPAPLQHTLLAGRASTGVSLQTLDERAFDRGIVLAQTPALRVPDACTLAQLRALVTPAATDLLVAGLRAGVHVPPLVDRGWWKPDPDSAAPLAHAPKITKRDLQLAAADLPHLARRRAALGAPLWFWSRNARGEPRRVLVEDAAPSPDPVRGRVLTLPDGPTAASLEPETLVLDAAAYARFPSYTVPVVLPFSEEGPGDKEEEGEEEERDGDAGTTACRSSGSNSKSSEGQGEEAEEQGTKKESKKKRKKKTMNLVLWWTGRDPDAFYIADTRIKTLKVEGDKAKPARLALKGFIVDPLEMLERQQQQFQQKGGGQGMF